MLNIGQMNFLQYVTNQCSLHSKVYKRMVTLVGVRRAIYFRLNMSKYYKVPKYDLMWFAIALIELQSPRLQHRYKDDYIFELKRIFNSLSIADRNIISEHFETLIYGRK